jgi:hypothetical protein
VPRRNGHAARPRRAKPVATARPAAPPQSRSHRKLAVESVPWSAEEFEGELVDRVRRPVPSDAHADESGAAAARGRADADRVRLYESDSESTEPEEPELARNERDRGELDSADAATYDSLSEPGDADDSDAKTGDSDRLDQSGRRPAASQASGRQAASDRG